MAASKGKRTRKDVAAVLENIETEIMTVYGIIVNDEFKPRHHGTVKINEGTNRKERDITKPDFKYEQIIHHVVMEPLVPDIMHGMYEYVMGSVPKRGQHLGAKIISDWVQNDIKNTKYFAKMDIRHFFQSIDHDILKAWIRKKFRNKGVRKLLFIIIDAVEIGLALGFYTSHWLANNLLQPLDHLIKEVLHVPHSMRFMDDMIISGPSKRFVHWAVRNIQEFLQDKLKLKMKPDWQVFRFEYESQEEMIACPTIRQLQALGHALESQRIKHKIKNYKGKTRLFIRSTAITEKKRLAYLGILKRFDAEVETVTMTHGRALDYMGFEFHRNRTIIRKSIMLAINQNARTIDKQDKINPKDAQRMLSRMGWIDHSNTYGMYEEKIKPFVNVKQLKTVVSKNQRRLNHEAKMEIGRRQSGIRAA